MIDTIKSFVLVFLLGTFLPSFTGDLGLETEIETKVTSSIEGKYQGSLTYMGSTGTVIATVDGTATISKKENTYTISFSDDVPSLSGLKFSDEGGSYATIKSSNSVAGIVIDEGELSIGVTKDGNTWAFSGEK